jgi:hypothetical protein
MWPVIAAGLAGFFAAGRISPKTKCVQKTLLGPRTGRTYEVEEFPDAGFLVVRGTGEGGTAYGVFQHVQPKNPGDPRFSWRGGKGPSESLHGMCLDLGIVRETPPAPPPPDPQTASREPRAAPPNNVVQHPAKQKAG